MNLNWLFEEPVRSLVVYAYVIALILFEISKRLLPKKHGFVEAMHWAFGLALLVIFFQLIYDAVYLLVPLGMSGGFLWMMVFFLWLGALQFSKYLGAKSINHFLDETLLGFLLFWVGVGMFIVNLAQQAGFSPMVAALLTMMSGVYELFMSIKKMK